MTLTSERIGIAPETLSFAAGLAPREDAPLLASGKEPLDARAAQPPSRLILPGNFGGDGEAPKLVNVAGDELNPLTWPSYLAWRKTKCRPRRDDRGELEKFAVEVFDEGDASENYIRENWPIQDFIEELDQATHELVGEVAELSELFLDEGLNIFFGDCRKKLIDEIGDIFFCGAWALDAWGVNPLSGLKDLELFAVEDESPLLVLTEGLASYTPDEVASNADFVRAVSGFMLSMCMAGSCSAGLTANAFKKLKFQRRAQDVEKNVQRIMDVLKGVNVILVVANSSVEEALLSNQKKLDARFPEGYKPGVGGGIRTGDGK